MFIIYNDCIEKRIIRSFYPAGLTKLFFMVYWYVSAIIFIAAVNVRRYNGMAAYILRQPGILINRGMRPKGTNMKKQSKKYLIIILAALAVLVLLLVLVLDIFSLFSNKPAATATPSPTVTAATLNATQTKTAPTGQSTPQDTASLAPLLTVPEGQIFALHISMDTGVPYSPSGSQLFDEAYSIIYEPSLANIDLSTIQMIVFLTTDQGNTGVYYCDSADAVMLLPDFRFASGTKNLTAAEELAVRVDNAMNARISWAGQVFTLAPVNEQPGSGTLSYQQDNDTVTLTMTNLSFLSKDSLPGF